MKVLNFIESEKRKLIAERDKLLNYHEVAINLSFKAESERIRENVQQIVNSISLLNEILSGLNKEELYTRSDIEKIQSEVHKITGDGEAMKPFNKLLGIAVGS